LFAAIAGENQQRKYRRDDVASVQIFGGTLIHNGKCCTPPPIGSLPVPLIESSFRSFSVAEICGSSLLAARFGAAMIATILLATIATAAEPEYGVTSSPAANPLAENNFSGVSHPHPKARLDKWPPFMSAL